MKIRTDQILRIIWGFGFLVAGLLHWLVVLGFISEKTPLVIDVYFDSLAVLNLIVAWGFFTNVAWAITLGLAIMLLQLPAHSYMIYLDEWSSYGSGLSNSARIVDIFFALLYIYYYYFWSGVRSGKKRL